MLSIMEHAAIVIPCVFGRFNEGSTLLSTRLMLAYAGDIVRFQGMSLAEPYSKLSKGSRHGSLRALRIPSGNPAFTVDYALDP